MFAASLRLASGKAVVPDADKALKWLQKEAAAGHPKAFFNLAKVLLVPTTFNERPCADSCAWVQKAAAAGHPKACFNLAIRLLRPPQGEQKASMERAHALLRTAANQ
ncbi:hypothetical protein T484DRAFT_1799953, partial [Baffinella frigidus]